jgi:hypothetical protein
MKSPSDAQNTSTNPSPLTNSILQAFSSSNVVDTSALPITMTQTSPESAEVRRRRLHMILDAAIALIDSDEFDPIDSSMAHPQSPLQ